MLAVFFFLLFYAVRGTHAFLINSAGYLSFRRSETTMIPSLAPKAPDQSGLLYAPGQFATHGHSFLLIICLLMLDPQIVPSFQSEQWIRLCEVGTNIAG